MITIRSDNRVNQGFTIVELLIVIVVVGILAAITIVAYNGITMRAQNISRMTELRQWGKLLVNYRALYGSYPAPSTGYGTYCLGVGFPTQSEVNQKPGAVQATTNNPDGYCRDLLSSATRHEVSPEVNASLRSVGSLPGTENHKKLVSNGENVGPYYTHLDGSHFITGIFAGFICPQGTNEVWVGNAHVYCEIKLVE
jgi:prepilin-type N-terminal cleavage/methylation domain-containing protein